MRFIPSRFHGVIDYFVGLIVMVLPIFFALQGTAFVMLVGLGLSVVFYSLFTDYELGMIRFLRLRFHLALDVLFGISMLLISTLVALPTAVKWLVYPIGAFAIILAAITQIRATGTASPDKRRLW